MFIYTPTDFSSDFQKGDSMKEIEIVPIYGIPGGCIYFIKLIEGVAEWGTLYERTMLDSPRKQGMIVNIEE